MFKLPVLPLREEVLLPNTMQSFQVGRPKSIAALKAALAGDQYILIGTQRDIEVVDPTDKDLYPFGTIGKLIQMVEGKDGTYRVIVESQARIKFTKIKTGATFIYGYYDPVVEINEESVDSRNLLRELKKEYSRFASKVDSGALMKISVSSDLSEVSDIIAATINLKIEDKVKVLEEKEVKKRAEFVLSLLKSEIGIEETKARVDKSMKSSLEEEQRRYFLEMQKRAIEKELGEGEGEEDEMTELKKRLDKLTLPEEARKRVDREYKRLKQMQPMAADAGVIRNYLDNIASLPWEKYTQDNYDMTNAETVLNADHHGMDKVKERVLEQIAVFAATKGTKGTVICLSGPPGVGKTTIAQSLAKALNKDFVKISLGGVRDESEIRGHRRTYVGALPGKIVSAFKKCGSMNPVVLLDEIDKMGSDHRGDPASAMLEVLDPAQNKAFVDHYLDLDFDLSRCVFIATANYLENVPAPLRDRMEIIEVGSYIEEEKFHIAQKHLIAKQQKEVGLAERKITFKDEAVYEIIRNYTREAGVRNLERAIAKVLRNVVRKGGTKPLTIDAEFVVNVLGADRAEFGVIEKTPTVGLVNGMAYSSAGGDLLQVEVVTTPGKGTLAVTGNLKDVMKESAAIAFTCAKTFLTKEHLDEKDVHIHFPDGATPKDGPSAGIALVTAIYSRLTNTPVKNTLSMTGEVTLRGKVLPIGGVKEKVISAHRGGVREVILPLSNKKDIKDIPPSIAKEIKFYFVEEVSEVLKIALVKPTKKGKK